MSTVVRKTRFLQQTGIVLLLSAVALVILFPFYWMFASSFKPLSLIFATPIALLPDPFTLEAYRKLLLDTPFPRWYLNSIVITASFTALAIVLSSIAGFGFGKYKFRFRTPLFLVVLLSMMIPVHSIMIPLFVVLIELGGIDSYWGVVLPFAANPFGIFFVRQYLRSVPDELMQAARIDGCSEFSLFRKVIFPLLTPVVGVMTIYFAIVSWNWFVWPLVVLRSTRLFPITVGLSTFITQYRIRYDEVMAGSVLSTIPLIVLFLLMQEKFVSGLTAGAVKS